MKEMKQQSNLITSLYLKLPENRRRIIDRGGVTKNQQSDECHFSIFLIYFYVLLSRTQQVKHKIIPIEQLLWKDIGRQVIISSVMD